MSFQELIDANQQYEKVLHRQVSRITERIEMNTRNKRKLRDAIEKSSKSKRPLRRKNEAGGIPGGLRQVGKPYFERAASTLPPPSADEIDYANHLWMLDVDQFRSSMWKKREKEALVRGVKCQLQVYLVKQAHEKYSANPSLPVQQFEDEMKRIEEMELEELARYEHEVNFNLISQFYVPERSAQACHAIWYGQLSPNLNKQPWTEEEDEKLKQLAIQYRYSDWHRIAEELNTHRSPWDVCKRHQTTVRETYTRGKWTAQEDARLVRLVPKFGTHNMPMVAAAIGTRTADQCTQRWRFALRPGIDRSQWSEEDDIRLLAAIQVYGLGEWRRIAVHVDSKTQIQCRERYENVLSPDVARDGDDWTEEENQLLMRKVDELGQSWSFIAISFPGRSAHRCRRQWLYLLEHGKGNPKHAAPRKKRRRVDPGIASDSNDEIKAAAVSEEEIHPDDLLRSFDELSSAEQKVRLSKRNKLPRRRSLARRTRTKPTRFDEENLAEGVEVDRLLRGALSDDEDDDDDLGLADGQKGRRSRRRRRRSLAGAGKSDDDSDSYIG